MTVSVQRKGSGAKEPEVSVRVVQALARGMLAELDLGGAELSVLLTDDRTIHRLNKEFRGKDRPTDVLAFAMREGEAMGANESEPEILGDIVISLETARRQADERGWATLAEVTHLLAHGLLHLVGYDHETDDEEREMNEATSTLVKAVSAASPPKERRREAARKIEKQAPPRRETTRKKPTSRASSPARKRR